MNEFSLRDYATSTQIMNQVMTSTQSPSCLLPTMNPFQKSHRLWPPTPLISFQCKFVEEKWFILLIHALTLHLAQCLAYISCSLTQGKWMRESREVSDFWKTVDQGHISSVQWWSGIKFGWELGSGDANLDTSCKLKTLNRRVCFSLIFQQMCMTWINSNVPYIFLGPLSTLLTSEWLGRPTSGDFSFPLVNGPILERPSAWPRQPRNDYFQLPHPTVRPQNKIRVTLSLGQSMWSPARVLPALMDEVMRGQLRFQTYAALEFVFLNFTFKKLDWRTNHCQITA